MRKLKVFEANICGHATAGCLILLSFLPSHCSAPSTPPSPHFPHNSFSTIPSPFSPRQSLLLFPPPLLPIPSSAQTPLNFCSPILHPGLYSPPTSNSFSPSPNPSCFLESPPPQFVFPRSIRSPPHPIILSSAHPPTTHNGCGCPAKRKTPPNSRLQPMGALLYIEKGRGTLAHRAPIGCRAAIQTIPGADWLSLVARSKLPP